MCQSVIDWPFILSLYLAYPRLVSRLISQYGYHSIYDTLYHSASLRKNLIPRNTPWGSVTTVILCACEISILLGHKKRQQTFLAPLPGKQLAKDIVNSLINFTSLSPLKNFLEVSNTINPKGTTMDVVRLRLFPFSLLGKAKTWFYSNKEAFNT